MTQFDCGRFPSGRAIIRTPDGDRVEFIDGRADVTDPRIVAGLRDVPAVFEVSEVREQGAQSAPAKRARAKRQ